MRKSNLPRDGKWTPIPAHLRDQCRRKRCQICDAKYGQMRAFRHVDDKTFMKVTQHLDHMIPRRWLESQGIDPHRGANLLSICGSCHGKKKVFEDRLFNGDVVGWLLGLRGIGYPINLVVNFALSVQLKTFEKFAFNERGQLCQ